MDSNAERRILMERYTGARWKAKVVRMSDKQVHAIFVRLQTAVNKKEKS